MDNLDVQPGHLEDIIRDTAHGVTDCLENGRKHTKHTSPSIFMAPTTLRSLSPSSFKPQVVSIGPIHRKQDNLQAFEVRKAKFVDDLLNRPTLPANQTLEACVQKVAASIVPIRACYQCIKTYTDVDLAKMMVMDACFILEFVYQLSETEYLSDDDSNLIPKILHLYPQLPYDLVLIENQIPFFVLNDIFHCTISKIEKHISLTRFIHPLLALLNPIQTKIKIANSHKETPDHILGLLYHCYKPRYFNPKYFLCPKKHSAIELDQSGVNFKPNIDASWPMAMNVEMRTSPRFSWSWVRPTLRMPALRINHFTKLVLRNLIAYEQSSTAPPFVTSYAMAMDMLIDTQEDIARLVKSKVIANHLGSNKDTANMTNNICKQVSWGTFCYDKEWKQLDNHCNNYWPRNILWLRRTYFSSPWSIIALLTGIVVFALTVIQTVYTVIQTIYSIKSSVNNR